MNNAIMNSGAAKSNKHM